MHWHRLIAANLADFNFSYHHIIGFNWKIMRETDLFHANFFRILIVLVQLGFQNDGIISFKSTSDDIWLRLSTVEMNTPNTEQLLFWCQYWILVAVVTVCERVGDVFISWLSMYSEIKLAILIYLWYPRTRGTTYVYKSFFQPYVTKHESEIDHSLLELRVKVERFATLYIQKAASYGQTRFFEVLQYASSMSTMQTPADQVS